jgi:hypothetical protein
MAVNNLVFNLLIDQSPPIAVFIAESNEKDHLVF